MTDEELIAALRREKWRERSNRYRAANPEKVRERGRRYRAAHPEKDRQWREANAEKVRKQDRERARLRREANPEKIREYKRQSYAANREKILENRRRYKAANPERVRAWRLRASHGMLPEDWVALWSAQQGLCYLCSEPLAADDVVVDHDHSCCAGARSCDACRRGLAHNACNQLIGLAADEPGKLTRIAENFRIAKRDAAERIAAKPVQSSLWPENDKEVS